MGYKYRRLGSTDGVPELERKRAKEFKLIKEYELYYLMGKYDKDGNLLYRECFAKTDIDGVSNTINLRKLSRGKYGAGR